MSALLPALFFLAAHPAPAADSGVAPVAPHGRYVEARTASVFAGACHFGGERTTAGREALLAWHVEGGAYEQVDLAGVDAVLAIASDANLAEPAAARRSVLYVGERASEAQRAALARLLEAELGAALGRLQAVLAVPLVLDLSAEDYRVECAGRFELRGSTLPDRACCKMPFQVWYAPLAPVETPIVGNDAAFEYQDTLLGRVWSRPDENAAFLGAFRFPNTDSGAR